MLIKPVVVLDALDSAIQFPPLITSQNCSHCFFEVYSLFYEWARCKRQLSEF
jgi:hypothetical protein